MSNPLDILNHNPLYLQLKPILGLLGIKPEELAKKLGREQVEKRLERAVPAVVARLEREGLTPALKGDSPEAERILIRSALYDLMKEQFRFLPLGANIAAGVAQDAYDDKLVPLASPRFDHTASTLQMVEAVKASLLEIMF